MCLKNCWLEYVLSRCKEKKKNLPLKLIMTAIWESYILYTNWNIYLFSISESFWNAKVGSQETTGVTGKFGLEVQTEAGQRLTEFCQESALVRANMLSNNIRDTSTPGHHQMVNTEIGLIISFAAKDGEALYSQQKQDREWTMDQIMDSLLPKSEWNWSK